MFSRFYLLLPLLILAAQTVNSQPTTRTISGLVTTEESTPLEGVAVSVKGTNKISGSQADGIYYITLTDKDSILVFSYHEYQTKEIKLGPSNEYNVVLHKKQPGSTIEDDFSAEGTRRAAIPDWQQANSMNSCQGIQGANRLVSKE